MPKIVMVHGAFNELWGPHELKARWLPALRDGLWHHGVTVADDDVGVVFYGDLFRRMPGTEAEARFEASRAGIAEVLRAASGTGALEAISQAASDAAFERAVDMYTVMATDPDLRTHMRERALAVVDEATRVVVAHSLGSVLSYQALCRNTDLTVPTLVTLGCPLASPSVFSRLDPPPVDGVGRWPGNVTRWVNVRAVGDKAAAVPLAERFGPRVEDVLIDNGHRHHDPEPYLNSAHTGAAVAAAIA